MIFSDTCCGRSTEHPRLIAGLFPRSDGKESSEVDTSAASNSSRAGTGAGLAVDATGGGHGGAKC